MNLKEQATSDVVSKLSRVAAPTFNLKGVIGK